MSDYDPKNDAELQADLGALDAAEDADKEKSFVQKGREFNAGVRQWMGNIPRNVSVGLLDAAINTADFLSDVGEQADKNVRAKEDAAVGAGAAPIQTAEQRRNAPIEPLFGGEFRKAITGFRDYLAQGSGTSDKVTQSIAQFALPATVWTRAIGGVQGVTKLRAAGNIVAGESIAAATALAPEEGRVADLLDLGRTLEGRFGETLRAVTPDGSLGNAYIDYMTSREGDSEAEGRFKNVVDNLVTTVALAGVIKGGAMAIRGGRRMLTEAPAPAMIEPKIEAPAAPDVGALPMVEAPAPEGYRIEVNAERGEVTAFDASGKKVGDAAMGANPETGKLMPQVADVYVSQAHRRKGVASAMYDALETATGQRLRPSQTANADSLRLHAKRGTLDDKTLADYGISREDLAGLKPGQDLSSIQKLPGELPAAPKGWDMAEPAAIDRIFERADPMLESANPKSNTTHWLNRVKSEVRTGNGLYQQADLPEVEELITKLESELAEIPVVRSDKLPADLQSKDMKGAVAYFQYSESSVREGTNLSDGKPRAGAEQFPMDRIADRIVLTEKFFGQTGARQIHTLLHEMSHAVSVRKLRRMEANPQLSAEFDGVLGDVKGAVQQILGGKASPELMALRGSGIDTYGLRNVDEFFAEAYSNLKFRKLLKTVKDETGKSAWDRFLEANAKLLGVGSLALMANIIEQGTEGEGA